MTAPIVVWSVLIPAISASNLWRLTAGLQVSIVDCVQKSVIGAQISVASMITIIAKNALNIAVNVLKSAGK